MYSNDGEEKFYLTSTLSTTIRNIGSISNDINADVLQEFYVYLKSIGTSDRYQSQNLKQMTNFAKYLGNEKTMEQN